MRGIAMRARPISVAAVAALALVTACGQAASRPIIIDRGQVPERRSTFHAAPVVDGSRVACLAPPYAPAPDASALADGTPVRREADGRRWVISLAGDAAPTPGDASALVQRLRDRGGLLRWISYGLYCSLDPQTLCFSWRGNLCETHVEEVAAALLTAIAADPVLPRPRAELAISLAGRLGPRCAATDPSCVPQPYDHGAQFDPHGPRTPGPLASHSGGACGHDGDCVQMGCGNHCLSWEHGGAHEFATCEGYVFEKPVFCGCVAGACAWFTQ